VERRKITFMSTKKILKRRRELVQIHNPEDSSCLPHVIVVARLHAQNLDVPDPVWEKRWLPMRMGNTFEQKKALTLMQQADCDTTQLCKPTQALAPEFRLKTFQFQLNTQRL
jgi:hypothetical protein